MIKAILLDADGVVIQGRKKLFSNILAEKQGVPIESVVKFFKNEYSDCALGKSTLEHELTKYLEEWNWTQSVTELLELWFHNDGIPVPEILEIVDSLKTNGIKIYLASDHAKYRADDIMNRLKMSEHFEGRFFSCDVGFTKENPEYYQSVLKQLNLPPEEVMFWDDDDENVKMASEQGLDAHHYKDIDSFKDTLSSFIK